jgi:hypothetical protein
MAHEEDEEDVIVTPIDVASFITKVVKTLRFHAVDDNYNFMVRVIGFYCLSRLTAMQEGVDINDWEEITDMVGDLPENLEAYFNSLSEDETEKEKPKSDKVKVVVGSPIFFRGGR